MLITPATLGPAFFNTLSRRLMIHCILRVRCNGLTHLPHPSSRERFVGWKRLLTPRYHVVDVALNDARAAVGLPRLAQHEIGGLTWHPLTGGKRGPWYVPCDAVTVLRPDSYGRIRFYAKSIADGDLVAADERTAQTAKMVWDGMQEENDD